MKRLKNKILYSIFRHFFLPVFLLGMVPLDSRADTRQEFQQWLQNFKHHALLEGISPHLLDRALDGLEPNSEILASDRKQPEFTLGFWEYHKRGISDNRIAHGQQRLSGMQPVFARIGQEYRIQPRFLAAFWGLESDYGRIKGNSPLIQSLATLAFDRRRRAFFQRELLQLLKIIDDGNMTLDEAYGSWAGAFGHTQFMPSTYAAYGVDGDGDGKINLIASEIDALASAANYLRNLGWDAERTWGREVILPADFDYAQASLSNAKPLSDWSLLGIRRTNGNPLPDILLEASLLLPAGAEGPAFLVYPNFRRIMKWNRSIFFALNVGLLSDAIAELSTLHAQKPPAYSRLKHSTIKNYQQRLNQLGFHVGPADGVIGKNTRKMLQKFQLQHGLPADGYLGTATQQKIDDLYAIP